MIYTSPTEKRLVARTWDTATVDGVEGVVVVETFSRFLPKVTAQDMLASLSNKVVDLQNYDPTPIIAELEDDKNSLAELL